MLKFYAYMMLYLCIQYPPQMCTEKKTKIIDENQGLYAYNFGHIHIYACVTSECTALKIRNWVKVRTIQYHNCSMHTIASFIE